MKRTLLNSLWVLSMVSAGCMMPTKSSKVTYSTTPRYTIDGSFRDWKTYETGWTETGLDWSKVIVDPPSGDIDLREFYYDNDLTYLYLFFKCMPTVQQRYEQSHSTGALGYISIDSDSDTNTGAATRDASGNSTIPGADIEIYLPIGVYFSDRGAQGKQSGCYVGLEMNRWDSVAGSFTQPVRKEDSRSDAPLIAHGTNGVEIALLLSDLKKSKGDSFNFVFSERFVLSRTTIRIK